MSESFTIAPLTGNSNGLPLGDDSVTSPRTIILAPPWKPSVEIVLQTFHPVRAKYAVTIARGGVMTPYTWVVTRFHADVSAAEDFKRKHTREITEGYSLGQFRLTHLSFGNSMVSVGALKSVRCTEQVGLKTTFEYTWQGTPFA